MYLILKNFSKHSNCYSEYKQGKKHLAVHQRFYAALALSDLVNEMSLAAVGDKYGLPKGNLQNLQQSASMFAGLY